MQNFKDKTDKAIQFKDTLSHRKGGRVQNAGTDTVDMVEGLLARKEHRNQVTFYKILSYLKGAKMSKETAIEVKLKGLRKELKLQREAKDDAEQTADYCEIRIDEIKDQLKTLNKIKKGA